MSCSFVGICKLLTPEWVSALSDAIGALALVGGVIVGEVIRRKVQARADSERDEKQLRLISEALYRMRSVAEVFEYTATILRDLLANGNPPVGLLATRIERALDRVADLNFTEAERSAFGPVRTIRLLALGDTARRKVEVAKHVLESLQNREALRATEENDRRNIGMVITHFDELRREIEAVYKALENPR